MSEKQLQQGDIVEWDGRRWWVSGWVEHEHPDGAHRYIFSIDGEARSRVVAEAALAKVGHLPYGPAPIRKAAP